MKPNRRSVGVSISFLSVAVSVLLISAIFIEKSRDAQVAVQQKNLVAAPTAAELLLQALQDPSSVSAPTPAPTITANTELQNNIVPNETIVPQAQPITPVSYTHLRAHETGRNLVCRLLL